jgi:hypothetical protein
MSSMSKQNKPVRLSLVNLQKHAVPDKRREERPREMSGRCCNSKPDKMARNRQEITDRTEQTGENKQDGSDRREQTGQNRQDGTDRMEQTGRNRQDGTDRREPSI